MESHNSSSRPSAPEPIPKLFTLAVIPPFMNRPLQPGLFQPGDELLLQLVLGICRSLAIHPTAKALRGVVVGFEVCRYIAIPSGFRILCATIFGILQKGFVHYIPRRRRQNRPPQTHALQLLLAFFLQFARLVKTSLPVDPAAEILVLVEVAALGLDSVIRWDVPIPAFSTRLLFLDILSEFSEHVGPCIR